MLIINTIMGILNNLRKIFNIRSRKNDDVVTNTSKSNLKIDICTKIPEILEKVNII